MSCVFGFALSEHSEFRFKLVLLCCKILVWKVLNLKQPLNIFHVLRIIMIILFHKTFGTSFYFILFRITFPKSVNSSWRKCFDSPSIFELMLAIFVSHEAGWRTEQKRNVSFSWNIQLASHRRKRTTLKFKAPSKTQFKALFYPCKSGLPL